MITWIILPLLFVSGLASASKNSGDGAQLFQALDQHGRTVQLQDFLGKSVLVPYFDPKDGAPGCTTEACSLRDGYEAILATGAVVLSTRNWADALGKQALESEEWHVIQGIFAHRAQHTRP